MLIGIKYISLNGKTYYCLKDLCNEFKLNYKKIKAQFVNSYICFKDVGSKSYVTFVGLDGIEEILSCYKCAELNTFYRKAVRDDFSEDMQNVKKHCIFLKV